MIRSSCTHLSDNYKIVTAENFREIEAIRPIWEQMQRDEPYPVPNADIDRYLSVIKASGDEYRPYVMLLKCNDRPAAITIGRIEKRQLNIKLGYKVLFRPALKCLSIVYSGIIGQPSAEHCEVLINELMNVLRRGQADLVFFNHLGIDSPVYKLCKTVPGFLSRSHYASAELHWQTYIPDTVEEFYRQIPNSRKRRWRRDIRQLEKISSSEIKVVCYRQLSDVNYLIDVACRIKESTYKQGLAVGFSNSDVNRALLEKAAEDGWLRGYVLYVGDEPCAFQFDVLYGKTQFTEFGSFDPKWSRGSPGMVLLIKVLEQLCRESDINIMDYGFGHALYKSKFGTNHWLEETVCIYAPRLYPILINMAMSANLACCVLLNRATKWLNMDSWIKRNWRRMICKKTGKDESSIYSNFMMKDVINIRSAKIGDVDDLIDLCRSGFPNSIEWQGPRYIGHNWWSKVLSLPFAETCVATRSNKIVGFCTLILDPVRFQIFNKQEALPTSFLLKLLIKKPSIFIKKIEEKLNGILNLIIGDLQVEHFETDASGIAWLELGSVLPMYRRRGIFKRMITFFENRSKECGMLYIGGHIEPHNSISTKFFLNMDYKVTHKATSGIVIKKKL